MVGFLYAKQVKTGQDKDVECDLSGRSGAIVDFDENCRLSLNKTLYVTNLNGVAEGQFGVCSFNETTQIGFEDVYATNNSIYALLHIEETKHFRDYC